MKLTLPLHTRAYRRHRLVSALRGFRHSQSSSHQSLLDLYGVGVTILFESITSKYIHVSEEEKYMTSEVAEAEGGSE